MKPKVLKTKADHQAALTKIGLLMDAKPGSADEADLELWSLLVENYERAHHSIGPPDPVEAIRFRMEQQGLRDVDMTRYFKTRGRVSEVLGRKRTLTLPMIRSLSSGLHIPAEVLIREPRKGAKNRAGRQTAYGMKSQKQPKPRYTRGVLAKYAKLTSDASHGAVKDLGAVVCKTPRLGGRDHEKTKIEIHQPDRLVDRRPSRQESAG